MLSLGKLLAATAMCGIGAYFVNKRNREDIRKDMAEYLRRKYQRDFVVEGRVANKFLSDNYITAYHAHPADNEKIKFMVWLVTEEKYVPMFHKQMSFAYEDGYMLSVIDYIYNEVDIKNEICIRKPGDLPEAAEEINGYIAKFRDLMEKNNFKGSDYEFDFPVLFHFYPLTDDRKDGYSIIDFYTFDNEELVRRAISDKYRAYISGDISEFLEDKPHTEFENEPLEDDKDVLF